MGFRSTFVTSHTAVKWPEWFLEKYIGKIWISEHNYGPLSSVGEGKCYMTWETLPADIQRAIDWSDYKFNFILVFLHECGGISRCQIDANSIKWSEPSDWSVVDDVEHHYCYGCSDI